MLKGVSVIISFIRLRKEKKANGLNNYRLAREQNYIQSHANDVRSQVF